MGRYYVSLRSYTGREALAHFAAFDTFHTAFAALFTQETTAKGGQAGTKAAVTFFLLRWSWLLRVSHGGLRCVLSRRRTLRRVTTVLLLGRVATLGRTVVTGRRAVGRLGRIRGLLLVTHDDRYLWAERNSHRSVWTDQTKLQMMESVEEEN
ncbi:hypothetical protein BDV41DRAFT_540615 [Aspergillus transmontanensis]|uniref:Uncharacterized protein n=1 Tax=Aspergillus transmontanensis TaxID=1034304 RepID=A0A5N6VTC5_9EURO|nr:hypothetical protein BDV41DRAFT_540615 [Aspergillus transmontanensis]